MSSDRINRKKFGLSDKGFPKHVAVIMDGNGRWAKKRLLNRVKGHEKGADAIRGIVELSREIGLKNLSLYAFSTENWNRPKAEVSALMGLLERFIRNERNNFLDNDIRLNAFGELEKLPEKVRTSLFSLMDETASNKTMCLNLCLSYGGRTEILSSCRKLASLAAQGKINPNEIDDEVFSKHLYTSGFPDPDILIRTSGEKRLSNFMMWQLSYAELFFTDTLWPDFTREEFIEILKEFLNRDRRFGKV